MPPTGLEHLLRELTPQVLGTVVRRCRDFAAAEDAVQEALLAAAAQWPRTELPANPGAWLTQVALNKLADQVRSEIARRHRETVAAMESGYVVLAVEDTKETDDTLILIFMCCHPSLTNSSAIALTLRAVGGLTTSEIAHAFLVPESTMAQRISRAKQTIKDSGVPFSLPNPQERAARVRAVLHVLYLIFNEGYTASAGEALQRSDLAREATRLARVLRNLMPDDMEVTGLLALMLLTDARRNARSGPDGEMIPLDQQDRSLWDHEQIAEGVALISAALPIGQVGPYQIQAAIAAVHDESARHQDTDWPQILALYTILQRISDNPVVSLNHAVALAMVNGPKAGLDRLAELDQEGRLNGHHRLDAVRAHLLEMAGDRLQALASYQLAASRTASLPERNYLLRQAARLREV